MTFADLIKDFLDSTKERLKTPISGAFLYSFLIYNWRPILLLLFSNASIEDKIIVINNEYCTFWSLFIPLVIATFYTLLVPKIMLQIENDLTETKKGRLTNIYSVRKHRTSEKKSLAIDEVELNDIVSGNKSKQELVERIAILEQSSLQRAAADQNVIESLNTKLKEANDFSKEILERNHELSEIDENPIIKFYKIISAEDRNQLKNFVFSARPWKFENFSIELRRQLISNQLVYREKKSQDWLLSQKGASFIELVALLNQTS
ncbi:hypothetical protein [Flavobacterium hercynium]|uniref:Uncharacterized protein n=1 Tax=Flavobacterium hercynium TaxID=387094 RepID=A0A226GWE9_9FLAO|nr:hypothetical protein [Flavobacterium hercynium]OXA86034.1 hypothetical protein B0A66_18385 [Flavobacterium hercynium]SMP15638.1 hypothetical protein SAMN06265346_104237 [Flavobacterium hercynium]